jgi:hypothetical protein
MVKKLLFFAIGLLLAVGLSAFFLPEEEEETPVVARKAFNWQRSSEMEMSVYYPPGTGPVQITWSMLSDVNFKQVYVKDLDAYFWKPTFGAAVKGLEGKEVYITGYVIPVDYDDNFFVVSRYPYANCYFCGGGGPETVCDLRFTGSHKQYKTDEHLTFKGRLKLNADDVYQMNYILEGAVEYKP